MVSREPCRMEAILSINYTIEKKNCYVLVKTTGVTDSPEDMIRYIGALIADCTRQGADKILLDHRELVYGRGYAGTYDVALQTMDHLDPNHPMKVALLSRPERMEFAHAYEFMGLGRGLDLKAFDREEMAMAWMDCPLPAEGKSDLINVAD